MVLYMNMKQLGKRRNTVDQVPFTYAAAPGSLRELIAETVKLCVSRYIEAMNRGEAVLSNAQIDDMAHIGKIAFGIVYGEKAPDVGKSIETAMLGWSRPRWPRCFFTPPTHIPRVCYSPFQSSATNIENRFIPLPALPLI